MRLRAFAGMLGALALLACSAQVEGPATPNSSAPSPAAPATAASTVDAVTVRGTQGLIVAELAYETAATSLKTAVSLGLVRPGSPLALRLRGYNQSASRALEVARSARSAAEQAAAVTRAMTAIASLGAETPAKSEG